MTGKGSGAETRLVAGGIGIAALVGIVGLVGTLLRLDQSQVFLLALIPAVGLSGAAVIAAVALVFRARRPPTPPVEKHVIHTKEVRMDGRHPPRTHVVTLPGRADGHGGLYPHLLRGAYLAGRNGQDAQAPDDEQAPEEWAGQIIDVEAE
jgi:hypothetical protein